MMGHRRAAMALHAIAEEDRSWVLNALPATDKATLTRLLDELKELGFADDASNADIAADIADETGKAADYVSGSVSDSLPNRVRYANAEQIFSILENEPASLIAQFLSIERWSWSKDFLDLFPAARKERILASISHTMALAPSRTTFLLDAVTTRLSENLSTPGYVSGQTSAQKVSGKLHGILLSLRRWVSSWNR